MNLLAFDTSTDSLSLALSRVGGGRSHLLEHQSAGGAQASATLLPAVQQLLAQADLRVADLDAIVFGRGPGSFTGLRTACAVAQGLAFGGGVPVLPVDTLLAVAEDARERSAAATVVAVLDARMDQVYSAAYRHDGVGWHRCGEFLLCAPEALTVPRGWALAGNAMAVYGERLCSAGPCIPALPTAAALLRLAPALLAAGQALPASGALPLYIRDKVAQTTEERAVLTAAKQALAATPAS